MVTIDSKCVQQLVIFCKNCGQCSLSCPTHFVGLFNPLGVLRDIQMEGPEAAISNQPIFNCFTCNRCMVNCPGSNEHEGMSFGELIRDLRTYAYENQILPKDYIEFPGIATILTHSSDFKESATKLEDIPDVDVVSYFSNSHHLKIASKGEIAYFADDLPLYLHKYPQYSPELIEIPINVVKILNQVGISPVVINMKPLGHDDHWAGFSDQFKILAEENVKRYRVAGIKQIIVESAEAYRTWKFDYPSVVSDCDFEVYHLSEYLEKFNLIHKLIFNFDIDVKITIMDSSRLGRLGGKIYEPLRKILKYSQGISIHELESNRDDAYDCAISIHFPENQEVKEMENQRLREIIDVGVDYVVTTSPKQIIHYLHAIRNSDLKQSSFPIIQDWAVMLNRLLYRH
ncbi:(Fe-S)-binding protein [Candidatus Harpocratesius sp.]